MDGFNIRDSSFLYEDFDLRDEELVAGATPGSVSSLPVISAAFTQYICIYKLHMIRK